MSAPALPLSLRLALRELRGGLRGFYVFVACIALGVGAIAGVNSVASALTAGIEAEGRVILGGDIAFSLVHREATPEEMQFFEAHGDVGVVATMRALAQRIDGEDQALVELKAVDAAYPHGGTLLLEDGSTDAQQRLAPDGGVYGAVAVRGLLDRLGLEPGDHIRLGTEQLEIRGVIASEPDRLSSGIGFGPRLIVPLEAMQRTGLVREGSLITWLYRIRMPDGANDLPAIGELRGLAREEFPEAGWNIRSRDNAANSLRRNIERFSQFLTLVGLTALVVGGVGVANAVASFIDLKRPAIATLKCLGATSGTVFRVYLIQILILAGVGIVLGLGIGAALPFVAKVALADLVPVSAIGLYPIDLGLAVLYGLLVTLSFTLGPLGRARVLPASSLFADRAIHAPVAIPKIDRIAQALGLMALAGLAISIADDRELSLYFVGGVVLSFIVLRVVGVAVMGLARRVGGIRGATLRLAIRNIHRPGALTPSVVLSLGLGLTLLVSLALIDTNLRNQLSGTVVEQAPDFFFVDIQNDERESFIETLSAAAPGSEIETVPMLRGRMVEVDGVPASQIEARERSRWALRGDRGITYAEEVPANSRIVQGEWWPADYDGEPLVSLEREIAGDLGLEIGETIAVNILGRNITARVANLRDLEWESLSINFVLVFSPNTLRGAPHAHLATLRMPDGAGREEDRAVMAAVTRNFPGVTAIGVRDAIESVNAVIADLSVAVRVAASLAIVISMLVLGGALAAGHRQRRHDAVVLKTLGATRPVLLSAFSLEYGLLGLATAFFAVLAGTASAFYVVTELMELDFSLYPGIAVIAAGTALAVTLGLGLAGTWRILSVKPAPLLKNL